MPQEAVSAAISAIAERIDPARQKLLILLNKADKDTSCHSERSEESYAQLRISAKHGAGLEELRATLAASAGVASATGTLVTNARHAAALREAAASLSAVSDGLDRGIPSDLLAEDLRAALTSLGSITGLITTDEVLGEIFSKFCIGK